MITKKQVKHIAKLARLGLSDKEIGKFQTDLSEILDYVEQLKEVDVSNVEPTSHPHLLENVFRQDTAAKEDVNRVNKLLEAAPQKEKRYVKVKAVL